MILLDINLILSDMLKNSIYLLQKIIINKMYFYSLLFVKRHELKLDFDGALW